MEGTVIGLNYQIPLKTAGKLWKNIMLGLFVKYQKIQKPKNKQQN